MNYVLAKRLDLLNEVQKLQESLEVEGDQAYTCETAGYFYLYQILSRWEHFQSVVKPKSGHVSTFVFTNFSLGILPKKTLSLFFYRLVSFAPTIFFVFFNLGFLNTSYLLKRSVSSIANWKI